MPCTSFLYRVNVEYDVKVKIKFDQHKNTKTESFKITSTSENINHDFRIGRNKLWFPYFI